MKTAVKAIKGMLLGIALIIFGGFWGNTTFGVILMFCGLIACIYFFVKGDNSEPAEKEQTTDDA